MAVALFCGLLDSSVSTNGDRPLIELEPRRATPLRVAITVPWGERLGGAENFLWTFLRCSDRRRVVPTVLFFSDGPFVQEVAALGIETLVVPVGRLRQLRSLKRAIWATASLLRALKPDLVINWSAKTQLYGGPAAWLAGLGDRVIWWQHGLPKGAWIDWLATAFPCRAIGCCSEAARSAQSSVWPHRPGYVVHPGIEKPPRLSVHELSRLRERLGIPPTRRVVGIVGRLQPWKGQEVFLRVLASLLDRGLPVHGLVVGGDAYGLSPGYEGRLHALSKALGIQRALTFTGQVSHSGPYFQLMEVAVSASTDEPFGLVLLEAMALGVPVVAFGSAGPAEIIEAGRSGILVPPADEAAMANAIEALLKDERWRRVIGAGGSERFSSFFTAGQMVTNMQSCIEQLAWKKPPGKTALAQG